MNYWDTLHSTKYHHNEHHSPAAVANNNWNLGTEAFAENH